MNHKTHILAIHQPNYFPWLGYFYKIFIADTFVLFDDVQFAKEGLTKRTFIRKQPFQNQKSYLTIPIKKSPLNTPIFKIEIDHRQDWQTLHLEKLKNIYQKSPFFNEYNPLIINILKQSKDFRFLSEFNIFCIEEMVKILDLKSNFHKSNNLPVSGHRFEYIKNLIDYFDAEIYLSGTGAKSYNDVSYFESSQRKLLYNRFYPFLEEQEYEQQQGDFVNGLSILDALFNIGREGVLGLFLEY